MLFLESSCNFRNDVHATRRLRRIEVWEEDRNERVVEVKWQFTPVDARIKWHRLDPATGAAG